MQRLSKYYNQITEKQWFVGLALVSFGLLLFGVTDRALWMDERAVFWYLDMSPVEYLRHYFSIPDNHPPLFYFLTNTVYSIFPIRILGIRLLSVLAGVLSSLLVYGTAKRLFSVQVARIASLLFIISPYFVLMSQMARYHALVGLWSLVVMYGLAGLWKHMGNKTRNIAYVALGMILVAWSDYPHALYMVALVNAWYFYAYYKKQSLVSLKIWTQLHILWAISVVPLVSLVWHRIVVQGDVRFFAESALGPNPVRYVLRLLIHPYVYFFGENILPWQWWIFVPGAIVLLYILYRIVQLCRSKGHQPIKLLVVTTIGLILLNVIAMSKLSPEYNFIVYPKYGYVAFPLFVISIIALTWQEKNIKIRRAMFAMMIYVQLMGLLAFYQANTYINASYFSNYQPYRYVQANKQDGDRWLINADMDADSFRFYAETYFVNITPTREEPGNQTPDIASLPAGRYWAFFTGSDDQGDTQTTADKIPEGFVILDELHSVPLDPTLKQLKSRILGRESYTYKYSVYLLEKK